MALGREFEIKLAVAPERMSGLKKLPLAGALKAQPERSTQVSVYFDTGKHKLHKNGVLLRVRRIGNRYFQTIKATKNSGLFERGEWEAEIGGKEPDLGLAGGTALEPLVTRKLRRQLKPLFETRVRRTAYPLANGAHAIELAVDRGKIDTGTRSAPLCEIELELERGEKSELFDAARALTRGLSAELAFKSKPERGYELIAGNADGAVKAAPVNLNAGMNTREAFKAIGQSCLKQIVDNKPALLKGDAGGVHQMRVGVRRLRTAISLFADLLRDAQTAATKDELNWLLGELAPARELEVLMQRVVTPAKKRRGRWDGIRAFSQELVGRHGDALTRARDAVASERFRILTLEVAAWLETGQWTAPQNDLVRDRGDMPIELFAAEQLKRRWRKIRKKARTFADLDARKRHKLRIQVKKVRYATEFFAALFSGKRRAKRRKKLLAVLECVQDGLGDLNDITVDRDLVTAIGVRRPRPSAKRAFAAGVLTGREDARVDGVMATAASACAELVKVKPFWR
jgi:inorganic triphosphatase YgiF